MIKDENTSEVRVINKNNGIYVVDTSDRQIGIKQCPYKIGDIIIVKYKEDSLKIRVINKKYKMKD